MRRPWWPWVLLLLAACAVGGYLRLWDGAPFVRTDSPSYMAVARELASGGLREAQFRTPGYPILLVATGALERGTPALFLAQLLLQVGAVFLVCASLRRIGASQGLTIAAGVIGLLPPFAQSSASVLTESLTQFCLALAVACLQRRLDGGGHAWLFVASAAFGYAALTRPTFQIAAVAVAVLLLLLARRGPRKDFRLPDAAWLIAGTFVLAGGYAFYSQARFGGSRSTLGFNLANRCPDLYEAIPDPVTRRILVEARNEAYVHGRSVDWAHFTTQDRLKAELGISQEQLEPWYRKQFTRAILSHPVEYAEIVAGSFARFWFPATGSLPLLAERPLKFLWYGVHFALIAALTFQAALFGAWVLAGARLPGDPRTDGAWTLWAICATIVLANASVSCLLETGETRYRTSTELLLVLAAAAGVVAVRGLRNTFLATARKLETRPGSA